jgi:hypothetical protein
MESHAFIARTYSAACHFFSDVVVFVETLVDCLENMGASTSHNPNISTAC